MGLRPELSAIPGISHGLEALLSGSRWCTVSAVLVESELLVASVENKSSRTMRQKPTSSSI